MSPQKLVARDRISNLPDEILGKILSLLWTNRAASTSLLSKRWTNLLVHVDTLEFNDASGTGPRDFPEFVDKTLALFTKIKTISLKLTFDHDDSRVNAWIRTALDLGCSQLHLENVRMHRVRTEFFRSHTLVHLTICDWVYPHNCLVPRGTVIFPSLKTLSLVSISFEDVDTFKDFITACPLLEDLSLDYCDDDDHSHWTGVASSPTIKRLKISHDHPRDREAREYVLFETPSLLYLDYSSYVADQYEVNLANLLEARLDLRSWEEPLLVDDEDESDTESGTESDSEEIFGDVTDLVAGISSVKTLHLSSSSLEVFDVCCESMPVFHNLLKLSFESDKEIGWQVLPLLLNNSPSLKTLVIKGLVHKITDRCGDACACIRKKNDEECCLSTCQEKVLSISAYQGTRRELKLMSHFLANLKSLETVKVGVKRKHKEDNNDVNNRYMRITNALIKLPRVSSNCHIHFF